MIIGSIWFFFNWILTEAKTLKITIDIRVPQIMTLQFFHQYLIQFMASFHILWQSFEWILPCIHWINFFQPAEVYWHNYVFRVKSWKCPEEYNHLQVKVHAVHDPHGHAKQSNTDSPHDQVFIYFHDSTPYKNLKVSQDEVSLSIRLFNYELRNNRKYKPKNGVGYLYQTWAMGVCHKYWDWYC